MLPAVRNCRQLLIFMVGREKAGKRVECVFTMCTFLKISVSEMLNVMKNGRGQILELGLLVLTM